MSSPLPTHAHVLPVPATTSAAKTKADVLVLGVWTVDGTVTLTGDPLTKAEAKAVLQAAAAVRFTGAAGSTAHVPAPAGLAADSLLLVGLGTEAEEDVTIGEPAALENLRRQAGTALRSLGDGLSVAVAFPAPTAEAAEAVALGAALGAYRFTSYLSDDSAKTPVSAVSVLATKKTRAGVERAGVIAGAVLRTRDLVNTPPLDLYPETFAATAKAQAKGRKVSVTVLDDEQLRAGGYGGLIGVGQGSSRPPRLVKVEYAPKKAGKHLSVVGKGITFDSGGLSLKPPASMEDMKSDMAGAAAALQTVFAVADLGLPVKVTAWLCLAENLPGGNATRPADVLRIYGGKTVEITNTDAEGRVVMADGLVAAQEEDPDVLLDVATLTGAQIVALGTRVSGVMGTETTRTAVAAAADATGEQFWPMPIPEELIAGFSSTVADLKNAGKRDAGMLAAGAFLREFVEDGQEWAHLDIAGPSYNTGSPWGYTGAAATGVPVRTLVQVAEDLAG
ncbi:leucyl aminopeptidase [Brevibacterium litoralis]|uniref:leucyl aminopeptidase n=1 Tax=Brevibacterium litoralis TaxID=3138935 RepID=UPI0032EAD263